MSFDENTLIDENNSLKAKLAAMKDNYEPAIDRIQQFKTNFGVRERSDGSIVINWDKFVPALGLEQALELRREIDEHYRISGEPGEKPKVKLRVAATQEG